MPVAHFSRLAVELALSGIGESLRDYPSAASDWFKAAANQGYTHAQYLLGHMHLEGAGVPTDFRQARHWLKLAAENGDAEAQHNMGCMCEKGEGGPIDFVEAVKQRAVGQDVARSLSPGQAFVKIVQAELEQLMGAANEELALAVVPPEVAKGRRR